MKIIRPLFIALPIAVSCVLSNAISLAQMPQQYANPNQTAMIFYPVQTGPDGQQSIYIKAGYKLTIPGLGIAPNASQIAVYRDPQNNFWYVDKNGNPTPVSAQQMQSVMSQIQTQSMQRGQVQYGQYPQGMPPQNAYGQTSAPVAAAPPPAPAAPAQSSNNNGSSAMMTGLAAAGGAAMGSMVTNSMYNNNNSQYGYGGVPYGTPVYKQPNGQYYYADQAGKPVYVAPNSTNAAAYSQYDKQPNAYSGQQAQSAYQQQQTEQNAVKQQNEQAAESMHKQQQNEQVAESMHKQQQVEQAAGQQNEGSGRRSRRKEESASGAQSNQVKAAEEENGSGKRRARLRKEESASGSPLQNSAGNDGGRLGGRFRQ
jgi:hypothetical protein